MTNAISEAKEGEFDFHVVDSSTITTYVTGETPTADFCILPVNAASKLLGTGENYGLLGVVTNGNMYFLTANESYEQLSKEKLNTLKGKTVGVVQLTNVPGLTLRYVLGAAELPYKILGNSDTAEEGFVNLKALDAETVSPSAGCDYYLCPEPAASAKVKGTQGKLRLVGSLQELYGEGGYPQAVLVCKKSVYEEDKNAVDRLTELFKGSKAFVENSEPTTLTSLLDGKRTSGLKPSFTEKNLTKEVAGRCGVNFIPSANCKEAVNDFLSRVIEIDATAAKQVSDQFYL